MVWFSCEDCGDSVKKPKLKNHFLQCNASALTCVDCQETFDPKQAQAHDQCYTEHEKYALAAASKGQKPQRPEQAQKGAQGDAVGLEFLAQKPPWKCTLCSVNCTSWETLLGHAKGKRHRNKTKAVQQQRQKEQQQQQQQEGKQQAQERQGVGQNGASGEGSEGTARKQGRKRGEGGRVHEWDRLALNVLKERGDGKLSVKRLAKKVPLAPCHARFGEAQALTQVHSILFTGCAGGQEEGAERGPRRGGIKEPPERVQATHEKQERCRAHPERQDGGESAEVEPLTFFPFPFPPSLQTEALPCLAARA